MPALDFPGLSDAIHKATSRPVTRLVSTHWPETREFTPLSISNELPSATVAVTFPPSPENTNIPLSTGIVFRGRFSNCSMAFWVTVSLLPLVPSLAAPSRYSEGQCKGMNSGE